MSGAKKKKKTKKEKEKEKAKAKAKSNSRMGLAASVIHRNEHSPPEQRINGDGAMCLPPLPPKPSSSKKESPSSMVIP